MTRTEAVKFLLETPYKFGQLVGFTKLEEMHNDWIRQMLIGDGDVTLQAHRGSYKTTCVSIALALRVVLLPNEKTLFMRKTDGDVKEVVQQVRKILLSPQMRYFIQVIYGVELLLNVSNATSLNTNLSYDTRGTLQLTGLGINSSITGKHFDIIFTDDIVNLKDRISKAERDQTKLTYQELQNVKNRGGRIFNTGTPWHKEDCFILMPNIQTFDCYSTGMISKEELAEIKGRMTPSLFSANYELRHIASDDVIFTDPVTGAEDWHIEQGEAHVDSAYGGEDFTAFTICRVIDGKYYIFGKMWRKHVDDVEDLIIGYYEHYNVGRLYCELNGDKGYLVKELRARNVRAYGYHEDMNKHVKITTYLKSVWNDVVFVDGTDKEYINQICDYTEDAEHDDAPDSASSIVRQFWRKLN